MNNLFQQKYKEAHDRLQQSPIVEDRVAAQAIDDLFELCSRLAGEITILRKAIQESTDGR